MTGGAHIERTEGLVLRIDIARPALRNALSPDDLHCLANRIAHHDANPSIRAIVLSGQGTRAFCAGLDLKNREGMAAEMAGEGPTGLGAVLRVAWASQTPIIGRINGACVAGGMGLLAACHVAAAADHAIFALPEVRHGLYPYVVKAGWAGRLADGCLDDMAKTGDPLSAAEARRIGLIDEMVPLKILDAAVDTLIRGYLSGERTILPPRVSDEILSAAEAKTRTHIAKNS